MRLMLARCDTQKCSDAIAPQFIGHNLPRLVGYCQVNSLNWYNRWMNTYKRHRFPPDIISYAVWLYYRFNLSHRDIKDLLAERGITVSRESIRLWCNKFSAIYTRRLKRKHRGYGDTFFIDEVFVKINGKQHYLWRSVDQDGEVVDVYLQAKRDGAAAKRFFKRLLRNHGGEPRKIVSDKLRSYGVAHRELIPETIHSTNQYENNRAEHYRNLRMSAFAELSRAVA